MSFSGNLAEIPLVDVIQLLHGTRKSGILRIGSRKGKSQLVFKAGYIVSASHLSNSVRIGEFMVERGDIDSAQLKSALMAQQQAEAERLPLIQTLLRLDLVKEEVAFSALQGLITKTIVEVLTWKRGSFELEPTRDVTGDDFKFYPENLEQEVSVDVQSALLDALRIYDEKVRDGLLATDDDYWDDEFAEIAAELLGAPVSGAGQPRKKKTDVTAGDLGLTDFGEPS